ncbi:DUF1127 domain-containing protein [Pseudorhodobacter wandonensis]|uniref:DUF1127 domain-containing protein n=1 Tax=Pseudorhodobacter wandonensis TaxID=1120568 RepID=UPI000B155339|nr:DUF1127 domain-containing protein [Pseudorhodobacter wandonensis]
MAQISTHEACPPVRPHMFWGQRYWKALRLALGLRRQRRSLGLLSPELLRDIGLTPAEAESESRRKLWDVPKHWLV